MKCSTQYSDTIQNTLRKSGSVFDTSFTVDFKDIQDAALQMELIELRCDRRLREKFMNSSKGVMSYRVLQEDAARPVQFISLSQAPPFPCRYCTLRSTTPHQEGCPRCTLEREDRFLRLQVLRDRHLTAIEARSQLIEVRNEVIENTMGPKDVKFKSSTTRNMLRRELLVSSSESSDDEIEIRVYKQRVNFHNLNLFEFKECFRITPTQADYILEKIGPMLEPRTKRSLALSAKEQLLLCLHWIGNGAQQHGIASMHGISKSTVCRTVNKINSPFIATHGPRQNNESRNNLTEGTEHCKLMFSELLTIPHRLLCK
ncbi:hypothetical protein C0J52_18310 [Blattella germanica]|nr:hypothetical protein C0J52_18310 [Blattella germanica]